MRFFKKYPSIPNYLSRFTVLKLGRLHIRLHKITSADATPYLHNHPFWYLSLVLGGGYTEQVLKPTSNHLYTSTFGLGSIIVGSPHKLHRIADCTFARTLFITWASDVQWTLQRHPAVAPPATFKAPATPGLYRRKVNGKDLWCKFNNYWYIGSSDPKKASTITKFSIHQAADWQPESALPILSPSAEVTYSLRTV
jgi:hypothetical protein